MVSSVPYADPSLSGFGAICDGGVVGGSVAPVHPGRSSQRWGRVCERLTRESLLTDRRVVWPMISCRVGKVVHPCKVLIYCNSRALGHGALSLRFAPM